MIGSELLYEGFGDFVENKIAVKLYAEDFGIEREMFFVVGVYS